MIFLDTDLNLPEISVNLRQILLALDRLFNKPNGFRMSSPRYIVNAVDSHLKLRKSMSCILHFENMHLVNADNFWYCTPVFQLFSHAHREVFEVSSLGAFNYVTAKGFGEPFLVLFSVGLTIYQRSCKYVVVLYLCCLLGSMATRTTRNHLLYITSLPQYTQLPSLIYGRATQTL